uniref:type II toxin-antitoxin system RelE/ParE family toxin n=1 Tax=Rhizobium sp. CFBP 13726 TaxID=2775296 RepID=UPI000A84D3E3|nr:type II toxin-antitoxin system RelE/ParE family toxin [Rhizobium sp. Leaf321]
MRVLFAPSASKDLEEVGDYIALKNPAAAYRFIAELRTHCERLSETPYRGRLGRNYQPGFVASTSNGT